MTLWELPQGKHCTIRSILANTPEKYRQRLTALGFQPGGFVSCVMKTSLGAPRLYQVDSAVYSLDDKIAKFIEISV